MRDDFIWGTATAAYQIEGAWNTEGKGASIWDEFTHKPDNIFNNDHGDIACNSYNMWPEDIDILESFNIPNYRCSLSWPRILPEGTGAVNQKGIDFYNRIFDTLLEKNITPWVTMYHWDLPLALHKKGGWENRDVLEWFEHYTDTLIKHFGGKIKNWIILNEPNVHAWFGYALGFHAPGIRDELAYLKATHYQNLVIGQTARQLKESHPDFNVGSSYQLVPIRTICPNTSEKDRLRMDALWNENFMQPLFTGKYPAYFDALMEEQKIIEEQDRETIIAPLDFVGIQHYNPIYMAKNKDFLFDCFFGPIPEEMPTTGANWPIDPSGIEDILVNFKDRYGDTPLIITENGIACNDTLENGQCHDPDRENYLIQHITAVKKAIQKGADVRGYFVWSLLDNFEWADGYQYRFGLVHIDYEKSCKRTPKSSITLYSGIIENNGTLLCNTQT